MFTIALCLGHSAGLIPQRVVASPVCARSITPARTVAVVMIEWSDPTLRALWGVLALPPLSVLNSTWSRTETARLKDIKSLKKTAADAETALGLLVSTAFLTSVYELRYTTNDDVRLQAACAVVVVAAVTGATKAAFLADNATSEAGKLEQSNDKFIPLVAVVLAFVLTLLKERHLL